MLLIKQMNNSFHIFFKVVCNSVKVIHRELFLKNRVDYSVSYIDLWMSTGNKIFI